MSTAAVLAMEDRKRPIPPDADDAQPPVKRQAVVSSSTHSSGMPQTQEDVIHFQKEAIWRQMQEYKRERNLLEQRLDDLTKRTSYHDDHLRMVDAWWSQLLDEVRLLFGDFESIAHTFQNGASTEFPSSLLFEDVAAFAEHLQGKKDHISQSLKSIFEHAKNGVHVKPENERLDELQQRLRKLLVNEKANKVEIARLEKEVESANSRLTEATMKYLTSEKKVDRLKSQTLAKIERQAMFSSSAQPAKKEGDTDEQSAKDREINSKVADGNLADAEQARKEAQAIASKQKEEIQQLQSENARMSEQVTNFTIKFGRLTEDDIGNSDAFKNLKVKLEDLASRYNHIEALNRELSEKSEKLEGERAAFKEIILKEQETVIDEMKTHVAQTEKDLTRVRAVRDDLMVEQSHRKNSDSHKFTAMQEVKDLAEVRVKRIESLELEVNRLRSLVEEQDTSRPEWNEMNLDQLKTMYAQRDKAYEVLVQEIPGLEQAFRKANELANKKVQGLVETEEKLKRLNAEKQKADAKYFAAMKSKDASVAEHRSLKAQNSKSSEIISQLKDTEKRVRDALSNLEKQCAEMNANKQSTLLKMRELSGREMEHKNTIDSLKAQIDGLGKALKERDDAIAKESSARRDAEIEVEKLHVKVEEAQRALETSRPRGSENSQLEALRQIALCAVCRSRFKNTAIRSCGHVFCKQCADERIASRSRKCPNCGRPFAGTDLIQVHL